MSAQTMLIGCCDVVQADNTEGVEASATVQQFWSLSARQLSTHHASEA